MVDPIRSLKIGNEQNILDHLKIAKRAYVVRADMLSRGYLRSLPAIIRQSEDEYYKAGLL